MIYSAKAIIKATLLFDISLKVDNIDPLLESLKGNNHALYQKPEENWYRKGAVETGHKEFLVQDPDGYLLRFAQDLGERTATLT